MSKFRRRLMALLALGASLLVALAVMPAPADAAVSGPYSLVARSTLGSVTTDTYGRAGSWKVGVNVASLENKYDACEIDWDADIYITGPHGFSDTDYASNYGADGSIYLLGNGPGTYQVKAVVNVSGMTLRDPLFGDCLYWNDSLETKTLTQKVVFKARSQITGTKAKSGRHAWRTTAHLKINGKASSGRPVKLQQKYGSRWKGIKALRTGRGGQVAVTLKGRNAQLRWYVPGAASYAADASPTFRLPKR